MLTEITIKNFRGFKDFALNQLERVNLIAGANGAGKTALLEALFLLIGETNLSLALRINMLRGLDRYQGDAETVGAWVWRPLFFSFDLERVIVVEGRYTDGRACQTKLQLVPLPSARVSVGERVSDQHSGQRSVQGYSSRALQVDYQALSGEQRSARMVVDEDGIRIEPPPPTPAHPGNFLPARGKAPLEEDAKCYGQLEVEKSPYNLLEVLRIVEPRLTRVATVMGAGGATLWGDIGLPGMVPLALMGDGLGRITSAVLRIATAQHGIVLIDEIENGIHYSTMRNIWPAIADAARSFDVQVFATTHSWECIESAHQAFSASAVYDFRLHRLDRLNGEIRAVTYDQRLLGTAIATGLEVR